MEDDPQAKQLVDSERITPKVEYFVTIYPAGIAPAITISSHTIEKVRLAEEERATKKNNKPPKPPKRPNIPIGRVALSN